MGEVGLVDLKATAVEKPLIALAADRDITPNKDLVFAALHGRILGGGHCGFVMKGSTCGVRMSADQSGSAGEDNY